MKELTRKGFLQTMAGAAALASGARKLTAAQSRPGPVQESGTPNVKWSYMDHWSILSPRGRTSTYLSVDQMDRYIRQLAVAGFTGFDTFSFRLGMLAGMFGSAGKFQNFLRERGFEKVASVFTAYPDRSKLRAIHVRETHDRIFADCEASVRLCEGLQVENFIVMPANTYWQTEPVTDDKLKAMAELWNRVGKMTAAHGMKLGCHHEFWCAIRTTEQIDKFYRWTDPRYVYFFCDTAQHVIAGVDPVALYEKYHDRCSGFHFKDTHNVDTKGEFRMPPDPELMAPSVRRWFWEMGTPQGLVDFPRLMRALKAHNYRGWITVEHDKADVEGGSFAESTCIAKWYIDNVLSKIYA